MIGRVAPLVAVLVAASCGNPMVGTAVEEMKVPPGFDPDNSATLVNGCGIQLPPGVVVDTGQFAQSNVRSECRCGETWESYPPGRMTCHIDINPKNCAGHNICETLRHELEHCAQLSEIEAQCQKQLGGGSRDRIDQCITCTKNATLGLMEAQAHCHDVSFTPPQGSDGWGEFPGAKQCQGDQTPEQICFDICWAVAESSWPDATNCGGLPREVIQQTSFGKVLDYCFAKPCAQKDANAAAECGPLDVCSDFDGDDGQTCDVPIDPPTETETDTVTDTETVTESDTETVTETATAM